MTTYQAIDYNYANRISQLRGCQLIAFVLQSVILYLESDRVGFLGFLFPMVLLLLGIYVVGNRWFRCIDGRYDFRQVIYVHDSQMKLLYAFRWFFVLFCLDLMGSAVFDLFGGFASAMLIHFVSPLIHAGLHSIVYNLANFLSVFAGMVCLGIEIFESIRS